MQALRPAVINASFGAVPASRRSGGVEAPGEVGVMLHDVK